MTDNEQEMVSLTVEIPKNVCSKMQRLDKEDLKISIKESYETIVKLMDIHPEFIAPFVNSGVMTKETIKWVLITGLYFTAEIQRIILNTKEKEASND